jgi:hypothetical protein
MSGELTESDITRTTSSGASAPLVVEQQQEQVQPETVYITSTCLFGANENISLQFKGRTYMITHPSDMANLSLAIRKHKELLTAKERELEGLRARFKDVQVRAVGLTVNAKRKGEINREIGQLFGVAKAAAVKGRKFDSQTEKKECESAAIEQVKSKEEYLVLAAELEQLLLAEDRENLPTRQARAEAELSDLKAKRIVLSSLRLGLGAQRLSQYEYGLQLSRFVELKKLGAAKVRSNINDKQYYLYLKEAYDSGLLSTHEDSRLAGIDADKTALTQWMDCVDARCRFIEQTERALAESLGMEYSTVHALEVRDRGTQLGKAADDRLFREVIMLNTESTPQTLVGLLTRHDSSNPYKEFYNFHPERYKTFHDVSHRAWGAKDVVAGHPTACVLESAEETQKTKLEELLDEMGKPRTAGFTFVTAYKGRARMDLEAAQSGGSEPKHLYYEPQPLTETIKEQIDVQAGNAVQALETRDVLEGGTTTRFRDFITGRADQEGSYRSIATRCGVTIE